MAGASGDVPSAEQRWPFVGRDDEVAAVTDQLVGAGAPGVVVLRGAAGVGKTSVAHAVGQRLATRGRVAVHLRANTALSAIPFGALAPLFVALDLDPIDGPTDHGLGLLTAIQHRAATRPDLVLVVDDVARADPGSLVAIDGVARTARLPVLLTARDDDVLPATVAALLDEGSAHEVSIAPLGRDEVDALLAAVLGGTLDPDACRLLLTKSGGNPLFLRELVRSARETDSIKAGPHGLHIPNLVPSGRLIDLIGTRFAEVDHRCRELLELLAAGGALNVDRLDVDTLDQVVNDGLAVTEHAGATTLARLAHPLYDDVVRATVPPHRWRRRLVEAAELIEPERDGMLRSVVLRVKAEVPLPTGDLVGAAAHAHRLLDHSLAIELAERAERAADASMLVRVATVRGSALSALGEVEQAEQVLRSALERAERDTETAAAAKALGQHLAIRAGRPDDAVEALDHALDRLSDPAARALLQADRVRWALLGGHALGRTTMATVEDGPGRLNVRMTEALIAVMGGALTEAFLAIDEGLLMAEAHRDELGHAEDLLLLTRCITKFFGGQLHEARLLAEEQLRAAGARRDEPSGMWVYALSAIDLHAGRASEALRWSELAVARLRWRDFTGLTATAEAVRATALAQLGRWGEARAALAERDVPDTDVWAALQRSQATTWLAAASRRQPELVTAIGELCEVAERGVASGNRCLAAFAAYTAVRVGHPGPVVEPLASMAAASEGDLVAAMAHHARALAQQDPTALQSAAEQLAHIGLRTAAADALEQAATALDRVSRGEEARRLTLRSQRLADGFDGARWPGSPTREHNGRLTSRELEVARLAADRLRSREIAAGLGVSVRTVDNHLRQVFRKLGVATREDLPAVLRALGLSTAEKLGG